MDLPLRNGRPVNGAPAANPPLSAETLLERCKILHNELEAFRTHLRDTVGEPTVESSHYRNLVKSELKNLEKLYQREQDHAEADTKASQEQPNGRHDDPRDEHLDDPTANGVVKQHILSSSNLPFLECVWTAAKTTGGVLALNKAFYFGPEVDRRSGSSRKRHKNGQQNRSVRQGKTFVDVVAKDGLQWIKVSLVTNHRVMMDKAREGWCAEDSESDDSADDSRRSQDDIDGQIPIVRMAESLVEAAELVKQRTRHPLVRLLLPKITKGESPQVDKILSRFSALGISVECGPDVLRPVPLADVMPSIVTNPLDTFSQTLNIDCTILLALVSNFSHMEVRDEAWFHRALKRQIELENKENLLPSIMYPALQGHDLVCTAEAAKRMREIVSTIGTPGEKLRTALLLDEGLELQDRRTKLKWSSRFDVPGDLRLPIRTISSDTESDTLPAVAIKVNDSLSFINQSVFMFGWKRDMTTITSNRTVVKHIENILEADAESERDWPKIWLCPTARSLVGKEKCRRG